MGDEIAIKNIEKIQIIDIKFKKVLKKNNQNDVKIVIEYLKYKYI